MTKLGLHVFSFMTFACVGTFLPPVARASDVPPTDKERREVYQHCVATCTPIQLGRDTSGFAKTDAYLFEAFCACQCARITSRMSVAQFSELRTFTNSDKPLIELPWYVELHHQSQRACTAALSEK